MTELATECCGVPIIPECRYCQKCGYEARVIAALRQNAAGQVLEEAAHTDHPMRHWDRTCPACNPDAPTLAKVIPFGGITRLDLPADRILEGAKGHNFEGVVIMAFNEDGTEYFASSYADGGTVLWLMERCKTRLLAVEVP